MNRKTIWFSVLALWLTASTGSAQTISLSGKVSNKNGNAISGAIVALSAQGITDTTDAQGAYSIIKQTFAINPAPVMPGPEKISFNNGMFIISLTKPEPIGIDMFDIQGNLLKKVRDRAASAGDYRYDMMDHPLAANVMLIRVSIGQRSSTFRYVPAGNGGRTAATPVARYSVGREALLKTAAAVDSLKVTASGYVSNQVAVPSYQGVLNVTLDSITLSKFSFFVTSLKGLQELSNNQNGFGGDLRFGKTGPGAGLLGADSICQCLAEKSMPGSKVKLWRAYLSATADANGQPVNAIDRIGQGPWYDRLGRLVASSIQDLKQPRPASADKAIINDLPNEYGVPNHQPDPNQPAVDNHLTVTGSDSLGRLFSANATCQDWTSNTDTISKPRSGLSWPRTGFGGMGGSMTSWVSFWNLPGCVAGIDLDERTGAGKPGAVIIGSGGGYGGFYCFAKNP